MSPRELAALKTQPKPVGILTLAQQIGALHRDIEGRYVEMHTLLTQARKAAGEDGWLRWLSENEEVLGFGERQARRYLMEPDVRTADQAQEAKRQRERRADARALKEAATGSSPAAPDLVPEDEDGVEPEVESEGTTTQLAQGSKKTTAVEASANGQPKKLKPGSPRWVDEQVDALCEAIYNLQSTYPKLKGDQQEQIRKAQGALEHVVRIGSDFAQVNQVSLELIQLWNQQGGERVEVEEYPMGDVKEAVACVPYIRSWKQVIEKVSAAQGSSWFTSEHFEWLTETRDQSDLDEIEREWAPAVPEAVGAPHEAEP